VLIEPFGIFLIWPRCLPLFPGAVLPLGFVDIVAFGAGAEVGAVVGSDTGAGVFGIVFVGGGVGAVIGVVDGGAVCAAAKAGASATAAAARRDVSFVFIVVVRLTW
jgi:hypothetical protein